MTIRQAPQIQFRPQEWIVEWLARANESMSFYYFVFRASQIGRDGVQGHQPQPLPRPLHMHHGQYHTSPLSGETIEDSLLTVIVQNVEQLTICFWHHKVDCGYKMQRENTICKDSVSGKMTGPSVGDVSN